jgi:hypothetical protein
MLDSPGFEWYENLATKIELFAILKRKLKKY